MTDVTQLTRIFKVAGLSVPDPAPSLPPEEAVKLLQATWPHLAHTTLEGPEVVGTQLVYSVVRPPAQTKGARRKPRPDSTNASAPTDDAVEKAVASLQAWADADSTAGYDVALHHSCGSFLLNLSRRPPTRVDPFLVGLS
ncbi:MAG: hypothetical protein BGO50_10735 [Rhodanobacter sp. 67-28]|nr:MAG: hypothetical protein ABS98_05000 [Xanthomonadaceae bacterium SCN 69-48]OJW34725.1 MAG: hypothetical protein BGO50_10735 [Rhodanobacter sp. 67-28]